MKTSVFLSYPKPFSTEQQSFIGELSLYLQSRGLEPRTLGVTDYDMDAPLRAIRRLMLESNEWGQVIRKWEGYVSSVVESKGNPPQLY